MQVHAVKSVGLGNETNESIATFFHNENGTKCNETAQKLKDVILSKPFELQHQLVHIEICDTDQQTPENTIMLSMKEKYYNLDTEDGIERVQLAFSLIKMMIENSNEVDSYILKDGIGTFFGWYKINDISGPLLAYKSLYTKYLDEDKKHFILEPIWQISMNINPALIGPGVRFIKMI
jgi:hypothetical protein